MEIVSLLFKFKKEAFILVKLCFPFFKRVKKVYLEKTKKYNENNNKINLFFDIYNISQLSTNTNKYTQINTHKEKYIEIPPFYKNV